MAEYWLAAFGLMLVIEGLMPLLFPGIWRETLSKVSELKNGQMRFIGLTLMLCGMFLIFWVN